MGEAKRNAESQIRHNAYLKKRRIRFVKGFVGFLLGPLFIWWMLALSCYEDDKWPWSIK